MFSELEQLVEAWESDEAREAYVKNLVEMDSKWEKLVQMNMSVMTAVVASCQGEQRALAHELCEGVMGLMGRMCEAWAYVSGNVTATLPEREQVWEESKVVDKLGTKLIQGADPFLAVMLLQVLLPLMSKWSAMFSLAAQTRTAAGEAMSASDASVLSSSCSEELRTGFEKSRLELMGALTSGSSQLAAGEAWAAKARPRFEAIVRSWGRGSEAQAMAAVVKELGFPDATM